ncbi:MAG TPA: glycosyltransferase [Azoarcus taiwanensis]|nr:glycosyltransferase [Azoarcus taiwanensis]
MFICTQHWRSCFQVGMHHIARSFAKAGWRVGFLSAPIALPHLCGFGADASERAASWRSGGAHDTEAAVWHYVPFSPLPWGVSPIFAHKSYVPVAWRFARRGVRHALQRAGLFRPDFACADHFLHEGLLRAAEPKLSAFRRADSAAGFPGARPDFAEREADFARRTDLTIVTHGKSADDLASRGVAHTLVINNGLSLDRFRHRGDCPHAYHVDGRPVVVFVGAADQRLDIDLLLSAVHARPQYLWAFIGPFKGALADALRAAGALLLGPLPHEQVPAYLQHARVGIVPFTRTRAEELISQVSSLKVFEYAACGLSVVAMRGAVLPDDLPVPLAVCDSNHEFVDAIDLAMALPRPPRPEVRELARYDWPQRLRPLFDWIERRTGG